MNINKLIEEFKKLTKQKNFGNLLIGVLILSFLLIAIDVIGPTITKYIGKDKQISQLSKSEKQTESSSVTSYEEQQRQELIGILEQISGVGKVDVKISYESGEEKVIAYDSNTQKTRNEETDNTGGKRVTDGTSDGSKVVMSNNGGNSEPIIVKTKKPKVISIVVVAEGANGSKIKYDLQKAVSNLFDLSLDKVNVYPMK